MPVKPIEFGANGNPIIQTFVLLSEKQSNGWTRVLRAQQAYDFSKSHPHRWGMHGMELVWQIIAQDSCVEWYISTQWNLSELTERGFDTRLRQPMTRYAWHSPVALYEGQESMSDCQYTHGECFGDSSSIDDLHLRDFSAQPDLIWQWLGEKMENLQKNIKAQREMERNFS